MLVSATAGAFFLGAANPIFYELGVEMTYPVLLSDRRSRRAAAQASLLSSLISAASPATWSASTLPTAGSTGVLRLMPSFCLISIATLFIGLFFVKERYNRLDYEANREGYQRVQDLEDNSAKTAD